MPLINSSNPSVRDDEMLHWLRNFTGSGDAQVADSVHSWRDFASNNLMRSVKAVAFTRNPSDELLVSRFRPDSIS